MVKQLKEQVAVLQDLLQTARDRKSDRSLPPVVETSVITDADAEFRISLRVANDFIQQNLPFHTAVDLDETNQLEITINEAGVLTGADKALHLRISSSEIRFKRGRINFGVKSNEFEVAVTPSIVCPDDGCMLLTIYGLVSRFNLKYFPGVMDSAIREILNLVVPYPLVSIDIRQYLDIDTELSAGSIPLHLRKKLDAVSLIAEQGGIQVKVRYQ